MAHMVEEMMYVGAKPWHGLGKQLKEAPSIKEGIIYAGLDWDVTTDFIHRWNCIDGFDKLPIESHYAVTRSTDKKVLGVVGNRYRCLQNTEAFEWFEPFVESGMVKLESAGSLQEGKKVWVLAKINGEVAIKGDDTIEKYILLSNSHDGSSSIMAGYTPIRVVCNNTLSAATEKGRSSLLKVRHTESAKLTLDTIRDTMNIINQTFEASIEQYQFLARRVVNRSAVESLVKTVLCIKDEKNSTRSQNQLDKVMWLWENGKGNNVPGVRGTAWTAYNALTEYMTYFAANTADKRFSSLWFGGNAKRNAYALQEALKIAA